MSGYAGALFAALVGLLKWAAWLLTRTLPSDKMATCNELQGLEARGHQVKNPADCAQCLPTSTRCSSSNRYCDSPAGIHLDAAPSSDLPVPDSPLITRRLSRARTKPTTPPPSRTPAKTSALPRSSIMSSVGPSDPLLTGGLTRLTEMVGRSTQATYVTRQPRVQVALKIPGLHPPDLGGGPALLGSLSSELRCSGFSMVAGSVRPGCVEAVMDTLSTPPLLLAAPGAPDALANPAELAHAIASSLVEHAQGCGVQPGSMVVQVGAERYAVTIGDDGNQVVLETMGSIHHADAPCVSVVWPRVMVWEGAPSSCQGGSTGQPMDVSEVVLHVRGAHLSHVKTGGLRFVATLHGAPVQVEVQEQEGPQGPGPTHNSTSSAHTTEAAPAPVQHQQLRLRLSVPYGERGALYLDAMTGDSFYARWAVLLLPPSAAGVAAEGVECGVLHPAYVRLVAPGITPPRVCGTNTRGMLGGSVGCPNPNDVDTANSAGGAGDGGGVEVPPLDEQWGELLPDLATVLEWHSAHHHCLNLQGSQKQHPAGRRCSDTRGSHTPCVVAGVVLGGEASTAARVTGANLIIWALKSGMHRLASFLHDTMLACDVDDAHVAELVAGIAEPAGMTLLHIATLSGSWDCVHLAQGWAKCSGSTNPWAQQCEGGLNPCHIAAALHDGGSLAAVIRQRVPEAAALWEARMPGVGVSAADMAAHTSSMDGSCGGPDTCAGDAVPVPGCRAAGEPACQLIQQPEWTSPSSTPHGPQQRQQLQTVSAIDGTCAELPFLPTKDAAIATTPPPTVESGSKRMHEPAHERTAAASTTFAHLIHSVTSMCTATQYVWVERGGVEEGAFLAHITSSTHQLATVLLVLIPLQTLAIVCRNILAGFGVGRTASALLWAAPYCCAAALRAVRPQAYVAHREQVWVWVGWCRVAVKSLMVMGLVVGPYDQMRAFQMYNLDFCVEAALYVMCEGVRARVRAPSAVAEAVAGAALNYRRVRMYKSLAPCVARAVVWLVAVLMSATANEWRMRVSFARSRAVHAKVD